MSMLKTRLSLCAQVIECCFCARVFSCPVGKACLALFRDRRDQSLRDPHEFQNLKTRLWLGD
jgi:hypothetical protein